MQLMRGSQANLPGEMATRWGPGGSQDLEGVWMLGGKKQECLHLGDTKYARLLAYSLYTMMPVDRVRTS